MGKERQDNLQRDARLGMLLRSAEPNPELLSWRQVEQLVAAAPPARVPWYTQLLHAPAPLRYAMAPLLLAAASAGTLWVMPAQSEQVGTMVVTTLPSSWKANDAAQLEVQAAAQQEFDAQGIDHANLRLLTVEREGRDQLVFVMLEARQDQAERIVTRLDSKFPALAAFTPEYVDIPASPAANRLSQLVEQAQRAAGKHQDANEVARQMLKALHSAGLDDVDVEFKPQPDGSLVVEIAATFSMTLHGHTQEELTAAGLDATTLGEARYQRLQEQLGAAGH
jgi:hypothetical protein